MAGCLGGWPVAKGAGGVGAESEAGLTPLRSAGRLWHVHLLLSTIFFPAAASSGHALALPSKAGMHVNVGMPPSCCFLLCVPACQAAVAARGGRPRRRRAGALARSAAPAFGTSLDRETL